MSTTWIVIVSVAAWLVVSLAAGWVAVRLDYRDQRARGASHDNAADEALVSGAVVAVGWPLGVALSPAIALFALGVWLFGTATNVERKRIDTRKARIRDLRADADSWDAKRTSGTDAERAVAAQVAQLCRDQADELAKGAGR